MVRGVRKAQKPDAALTTQGAHGARAARRARAAHRAHAHCGAHVAQETFLGLEGFMGLAGLARQKGLAGPMEILRLMWGNRNGPRCSHARRAGIHRRGKREPEDTGDGIQQRL